MEMGRRILQTSVNFLVRAVIGMSFIFLINACIADLNGSLMVGQNVYTFLTSGFLGIPGVCVLYGIQFLHFL